MKHIILVMTYAIIGNGHLKELNFARTPQIVMRMRYVKAVLPVTVAVGMVRFRGVHMIASPLVNWQKGLYASQEGLSQVPFFQG